MLRFYCKKIYTKAKDQLGVGDVVTAKKYLKNLADLIIKEKTKFGVTDQILEKTVHDRVYKYQKRVIMMVALLHHLF